MPISGSCHCGATKFEIDFAPETATRCNCSFCTKKGALWAYCEPDQFRLTTPIRNAAQYSPTTPENKHYFCPTCGCATFSDNPDYSVFAEGDWEESQARFDPTKRRISINLWVLDDFDIEALPIEHVDGRNQW
ncbi:MAG: GFA family protein [Pelagibacterium sp.]|uniref:GFA family protein n=1 Tax=Pelagibacterium sp. TaxID=1967288 RepID=UPI0032EB6FC7